MRKLRTLNDGHLSKLDLEVIRRNFIDRQASQARDTVDLRTGQNPTPGADSIKFSMLNNSLTPESMKSYAQMESLDAVRLVSDHDHKMIAGMPAIENGDLYFEVGAVDDKETLDAGAAAYGMRSGESMDMEATVRYEGGPGTISMTHLDTTPTTETICDSGGATWWMLGDVNPPVIYPSFQGVTLGDPAVIPSIQVYLKRSSAVTAATVRAEVYPDDGTGHPNWNPNHQKCVGTADVSSISTTGEWVTITLYPAPRFGGGRLYHIMLTAEGIEASVGPAGIWWYTTDVLGGVYADGLYQFYSPYAPYWLEYDNDRDAYLKIEKLTETTTTLVTASGYDEWQEASADVTLRMAHDMWEKSNFADFYLTVPAGMAVNALCLRDKASGGEAHWRCDHVRTRHIMPTGKFVSQYFSSTDWDGDAKDVGDIGAIDLSTVFGLPAGVKAISVQMTIRDETVGVYATLSKDANNSYRQGVKAHTQVADAYIDVCGIVPCDSDGSVYFYLSGELDLVYIFGNGYWIA